MIVMVPKRLTLIPHQHLSEEMVLGPKKKKFEHVCPQKWIRVVPKVINLGNDQLDSKVVQILN